MRPKLSPRELAFVVAYVTNGENGKQAAIEAGYSERSAHVTGSQLLKRPNVVEAIELQQQRIAGRLQAKHDVTLDRVVSELAKIGFANMADYMVVGADGLPRLNWARLTRDQQAAISEVTVDVVGDEEVLTRPVDPEAPDEEYLVPVRRVKFKLHDKRSALVDLGKHLGMYDGRNVGGDTTIINQDNRSVTIVSSDPQDAAKEYLRLMRGEEAK